MSQRADKELAYPSVVACTTVAHLLVMLLEARTFHLLAEEAEQSCSQVWEVRLAEELPALKSLDSLWELVVQEHIAASCLLVLVVLNLAVQTGMLRLGAQLCLQGQQPDR